MFLVPLLRSLAGRTDVIASTESAELGCDLPANDERADYMRATLTSGPGDLPIATPLPIQDSSMMRALAKSDCLVVREPFDPARRTGETCHILKLPL